MNNSNILNKLAGIVCILITPWLYAESVHHSLTTTRPQTALRSQQKITQYFMPKVAHLLDPTHYDDNQKANAETTIHALGNTNNPLVPFDLKFLSQLKKKDLKIILDNNRPYIGLVHLYYAIQNLGLTNLHTIYNQRVAPDGHTQSPLAQDKIRALYRIQDPKWKENLKQADTTELQRQILELMADQLAETHKTRMTLERLLATSSASLLQANTALRSTINEQTKQLTEK